MAVMTYDLELELIIDNIEQWQAAYANSDIDWQGEALGYLLNVHVPTLREALYAVSHRGIEQRDKEHKRLIWGLGAIVFVAACVFAPFVYKALA